MFEKVRRRLIALQNAVEGSSELASARAKAEEIEQKLSSAQAGQKDTELESRALTEKIRDSEKTLMSGDVRNPKELEALQSSIESMKSHRTTLEERSVEFLVQVDNFQSSLESIQSNLKELEESWAEKQSAIETEITQRKKEYIYLKKAREQVAEMLPTDNLEMYEHLRRRKNGVAVAKLEGEICGACHTQVATGILDSIRYGDDLLSCPSCGRIILFRD